MLKDIHVLGVSAGASAPEVLVSQLLENLSMLCEIKVTEQQGLKENVVFKLPSQLKDTKAPTSSLLNHL